MRKIIIVASLLVNPVWADNEPIQPFMGIKGGSQWALDESYQDSDPNSLIWGVYSGLQFTPAWGWDVGYQYHNGLEADATSVNIETWLIESALRYDWYLQDDLSLYGRLGVAYWDMKKTQLSSDKAEATGFSPLGEVGVNYNLNPNVRLSAGYQYIDSIGQSNTGKYDSHGLLVGLTYTFGGVNQPEPVETASTPTIEEAPVKEVVIAKLPPQIHTFSSKTTDGLFEFDSVEPSPEFIEGLTDTTSVLKAYPQAKAVIVGHTDSTGSASYNQKLSERRAQAVANQLIELGVTSMQLEWRGEGEYRPIADNSTAEGQAENRRVEITIPSFQFQE